MDKRRSVRHRLRGLLSLALSLALLAGALPSLADELQQPSGAETTDVTEPTATAPEAVEEPTTEPAGEETEPVEPVEQSAVSADVKLPNGYRYQLIAPGSAANVLLINTGDSFASGTVITLMGDGLSVSPASVTLSGTQSASFAVTAASEGVYRARVAATSGGVTQYTCELLLICVKDRSSFAIPVICSDMSGAVIRKIDYVRADDPTTRLEVNSALMPAGYKAAWSISNTTGAGNAVIKLTSSGSTLTPPILYSKSNLASVEATVTLTVTLPAGEKLVRSIPVKYEVRSQVPTSFKSTGDVLVAQLGEVAAVDLTTGEAGSALTDGMTVKAAFSASYDAQLTTTTFSPESGFSIGATKPGLYRVKVTATSDVSGVIDGVEFSKDVYLIVADAQGQLPDGLFALAPESMESTLYLNTTELGSVTVKASAPITANDTFTTAWQITDASGAAAALKADTASSARGNTAVLKVTGDLKAGQYTVTATVNFRGAIKTLKMPLSVKTFAPQIDGLRDSYVVPYSYSEYVISAPGVVLMTASGTWEEYTGSVTWTCEAADAASKAAFSAINTDRTSGYTQLKPTSPRKPGRYAVRFTATLADGRTASQTVTLGLADASGVVPTPEPTADPSKPRKGTVNARRVNVRAGAGTTYGVVAQVTQGERLTVTDWSGEWYKISIDGRTAYIKGEYVTLDAAYTPAPTATPTPAPTKAPTQTPGADTGIWGKVTLESSGSTLRLRAAASGSASVLANMPNGAVVEIKAASGDWYRVVYNGREGYCARGFITLTDAPASGPTATPRPTATATVKPTVKPTATTGTVTLSSTGSRLIIRSAASKTAAEVTRLAHGTRVTILGAEGDFYRIQSGSVTGYAAKAYIKLDSSATATTTPKPTATPKPTSTPAGNYATVIKSDGLALHETEQGATVRTIPNYGVVQVLNVYGQWSRVSYEGTTGYVESKYLKSGILYPDSSTYPKARVSLASSSSMYMRASASRTASVVTSIPNGATVEVLSRGATWSKIRYSGSTGYCMTQYLTMLG